jgi:carboxymethylenebutenolidase
MPDTRQYEGMIAETISVVGDDGSSILAYFARPLGPGPFPGIVLLHHMPGWDELYREFTQRFAHHGYMALSPDLYFRAGRGEPDDVAAHVRAEGGVMDDQVVGDASGCVRYLRSLPTCNGKVGLFGTCSGGRHAYLAACRGEPVDALINCWGGRVVASPDDLTDNQPVAPVDYTSFLPCPVLGLFGNDDKSPSPEHVDALEAALDEHGKTWEHHRYDGAGHAFFYHDRPAAFRAEQAMDGWARIWDFLARTLD